MRWTRFLRISAANIGPNRFPPKPDGLVADVDASLGQQVLHVPQRQRVFHIITTVRITSGELSK